MTDPQVDFHKLDLLNKSETRVHRQILDHIQKQDHRHLQVFPQVAVTAVIDVKSQDSRKKLAAFNKIMAKRFDFVIADRSANAVMAIEYNGSGHYRNKWKKRDQIKSAACKLAGLPLLVIEAPDTFEDVRAEFERIVRSDQDREIDAVR
ncbi:MAG: DUF2726 domain-containing protein [Pseudomonadota bacterium]